jgi:hypothetical protein
MSKNLIKLTSLEFVSKVVVKYHPLDGQSVGTREFLRRAGAAELRETNRKCEVVQKLLDRPGEPCSVDFTFSDGSERSLQSTGMSWLQITHRMNQKRGMLMVEEQYKQNPAEKETLKAISEHFKQLESLGFDSVPFEIHTSKYMNGVEVHDVSDAEAVELGLLEEFAAKAKGADVA